MKLEAGKYYRTRDGRKVGPITLFESNQKKYFHVIDGRAWWMDGYCIKGETQGRGSDLIAEWTDEPKEVGFGEPVGREFGAGPVRTVTRKEIVPGVYGKVRVYDDGAVFMYATTDRADLTAAIETLTAIKEAME